MSGAIWEKGSGISQTLIETHANARTYIKAAERDFIFGEQGRLVRRNKLRIICLRIINLQVTPAAARQDVPSVSRAFNQISLSDAQRKKNK
jgi:hypothetical protein